jgi:hypothetical protein
MHPGEGLEKSKDIQEPQNHENDHESIQDRLNRPLHRYEAINQPQENTDYDQHHENLNYRHDLLTSLFSEADAYPSAPRCAQLRIACGFTVGAATVPFTGASRNPRRPAFKADLRVAG